MDLRNALKGGMLENYNGVIFDFFLVGEGDLRRWSGGVQ